MIATAKLEQADEHERNAAALAEWRARLATADRFDRDNALRMVAFFERRIKIANGEPVEQVKRKNYGYGFRRAR
jgi:hypothetical protein